MTIAETKPTAAPRVPADLDAGLARLLADHQVLYQKLRSFHWNVKGPLFFALHAKFEELYGAAAEAVDDLAERLAARGVRPPSTLREQLELAGLGEDNGRSTPESMVRAVADDYLALGPLLRELARGAHALDDVATANLLDGLADAQEKERWMLRSFLAS